MYAIYNTNTKEITSRRLDSDMIDYQMYTKNKIKHKHLKVIKNPEDNEIIIDINGAVIFKDNNKPQFLGFNY